MSGGSWNYMYCQDVLDDEQLEQMANRLQREGYPELAKGTRALIRGSGDDPLRAAWMAVEWYDSSDWSARHMHQILEAREQELNG